MACDFFRTIILSKARFDFGFIFLPGSLLLIKPHISASYFKVFIEKATLFYTLKKFIRKMNTEIWRCNNYKSSVSVVAPGHHKVPMAFVILAILFFITSYCCLHTCFHLFCHAVQNTEIYITFLISFNTLNGGSISAIRMKTRMTFYIPS